MLLRSNALPPCPPPPPSCHSFGMRGNTIVWSSGQSQCTKHSTTKDTVRGLVESEGGDLADVKGEGRSWLLAVCTENVKRPLHLEF